MALVRLSVEKQRPIKVAAGRPFGTGQRSEDHVRGVDRNERLSLERLADAVLLLSSVFDRLAHRWPGPLRFLRELVDEGHPTSTTVPQRSDKSRWTTTRT